MYYMDTYRVGARDTDPFNCCRSSSVLNFLQEAATQAAGELGVSRDEIVEKYNCFWMLVRMWYRLDRPLHWNDELTVKTWHRGGKSAAMYFNGRLLNYDATFPRDVHDVLYLAEPVASVPEAEESTSVE